MADSPRNDLKDGAKCRDGRDFCEDCRGTDIDHIRSIHFTLCQKPWLCFYGGEDGPQRNKCGEFHAQWHRVRAEYEDWLQVNDQTRSGTHKKEIYYGHCKAGGAKGYIP